jgi:methionyl-tRNA synthetase
MEQEFRGAWKSLDISFDDFIRTTEPRHRAGVSEIARRLHASGDIYEGIYEGWYCVSCEAFKQDKDLVNGKCPLHPTLDPQWIKEKNHFFRLSKYQARLLEHFRDHPEFVQPDIRRNEMLRLLEGGLEDVSVSRAGQAWGIPLPFDASSVAYVWFDALINYASAVGLGTDAAALQRWWPADLHVIGKDITRFHTVIWPAMLMAADLPLPRQVFGHGFLTVDGQRMSKSNPGTIIDPADAAGRFGADALRLYLTKEIAFGSDGDFSWERYEERYNVDLANNLGNLVSRVSAMAHRYRNGRVSSTGGGSGRLAQAADEAYRTYRRAMDEYALHEAVSAAFGLVDATNEFIAETSPWKLAKDPANADRLSQVLFDATETIRIAAVLLTPTMPKSAAEILRRVGVESTALNLDRDGTWRGSGERLLTQDGPLWPRYETRDETPSAKRHQGATPMSDVPLPPDSPASGVGAGGPRPDQAGPAAPVSTDGGRISIDQFLNVELRVAKVLAAERVPKSTKLLKLLVDVGTEQRTIVAGIAEAYGPDAMVGRTVAVVFNLKPAKLMGVESNGMVLAASPDGGRPILVSFEEPPPPGTRVR